MGTHLLSGQEALLQYLQVLQAELLDIENGRKGGRLECGLGNGQARERIGSDAL